MSKKIFIIRDPDLTYAKYESWLQVEAEFEIVGEAQNIKDIHKHLKNIDTDVIIIDSELYDLEKSLDLLDKIEKYNIKKLIVISHHSNHIFMLNKIKSEVKAYTSDHEFRTIFLKALKGV